MQLSDAAFRFVYVLHVWTWHTGAQAKIKRINKKEKKNKEKKTGSAQNIRVPRNIYTTDTGTCISLVGETQHCKSNAFTELLCPLLNFQGPLGNW